jgi:steroid delta-isomerase-like uncharacterized protein
MADPAAISREYIEAWNRRDFARYRELLHPQYSYTGSDGARQEGPDAGVGVAQMYAAAFPDGKLEIERIHSAGNFAFSEYTGSGTHSGDLMGIAATGRRVSLPICNVLEIRDGKIFAERDYMDMAHMMQQLGVTQMPATAHA